MRRFINEKIFIFGTEYKFYKTASWYTCSECDFKKNYTYKIFSLKESLFKRLPCKNCNLSRVEPQERICLHETI